VRVPPAEIQPEAEPVVLHVSEFPVPVHGEPEGAESALEDAIVTDCVLGETYFG